jgi:uncharacterized lipoprotein YmbA
VLVGCLPRGPSKPTDFYVLNSLYSFDTDAQAIAELKDISVAVGPIRLPQLLDRSQIVIRQNQNKIQPVEYSQWSEPLRVNFARVLAENLTILLDSEQISIFPFLKEALFDFQVTVEVTRFDGNFEEGAQMRTSWTIWGPKRRQVLLKNYSRFSKSLTSNDIEALVAAKSHIIAALSKEIADAIKSLAERQNGLPK